MRLITRKYGNLYHGSLMSIDIRHYYSSTRAFRFSAIYEYLTPPIIIAIVYIYAYHYLHRYYLHTPIQNNIRRSRALVLR